MIKKRILIFAGFSDNFEFEMEFGGPFLIVNDKSEKKILEHNSSSIRKVETCHNLNFI